MSGFKFRVLLDSEKNEEIFRDIVIDKEATFETFYKAIIAAYRFEGNQMASFYMSNDSWDKGFEITLMDMSFDEDMIEPCAIMSEQKLVDFVKEADQKIILVHDFMRMWIFLIELIEIVKGDINEPQVALSVGIAPPEDSKMMNLDDDFDEDFEGEYDEDDEFGGEFEDDYDEDDYNSYDEYDY
jgi:hypothetical protein